MKLRKYLPLSCITMATLLQSTTGATREVGSGQIYSAIGDAVAAASPNDTITVHAGTYSEVVTINKIGLTITSNPGDSPIIVGKIYINAGMHNTTINGLEIKKWGTGGTNDARRSGIAVNYPGSPIQTNGTTIINCVIHGGDAVAKSDPIDTNGQDNSVSCGIYIRNHARTTINNVEIYGCVTGIYTMACKSTDNTFENGTKLSNVHIHDNKNDGIAMNGKWFTLEDSRIYDNISVESTSSSAYHSDGIQIINNTGSNGTTNTDGVGCAQHVRISRNTFGNATQNIFLEGPNSGGDYLDSSPYVIEDVVIANNVLYSTVGANIHGFNGGSLNKNGTKGILLKFAADCKVYNNTISETNIGIESTLPYESRNNILNRNTTGFILYRPTGIADGALDYDLFFGNNCAARWGNTTYPALDAFRNAVPQQQAHSTAANPDLVSIQAPILRPGSGATGKALNLGEDCLLDRVKYPRQAVGLWDSGALAQPTVSAPENLTIVP